MTALPSSQFQGGFLKEPEELGVHLQTPQFLIPLRNQHLKKGSNTKQTKWKSHIPALQGPTLEAQVRLSAYETPTGQMCIPIVLYRTPESPGPGNPETEHPSSLQVSPRDGSCSSV